ncbi:MAG: hypothetical protein EA362_01575 [Saprospirales bacterium]|nr:MAG: hypothetical protein EA362_01575 [Saprospirales bacterium]
MDKDIEIIRGEARRIKRIVQYFNKVKHGQWISFFESGLIQEIGNYNEGIEFGIWKEWYRSGQLKEECHYREGRKIPLNFWDEQGNKLLENGTGHTIEKFGTKEYDVYKHFYQNGEFKSKEKIEGVSFGKFKPNTPHSRNS